MLLYYAVLAPGGMIYFIPHNADSIGELTDDPVTNTFSTVAFSSIISAKDKFFGGVLGPDGKIFMRSIAFPMTATLLESSPLHKGLLNHRHPCD